MILLDSSHTLQILLGGATTTTPGDILASWADIADDGSSFAPGCADNTTNGTTAVTIAGSPASSIFRQLKYLSVYNADTVAMTVTARVSNGGTHRKLITQELDPGERLEYVDGRGFQTAVVASGGSGGGDVEGPSSAVDLTLPRFDGTSGKQLKGSGIAVSDLNEISGYKGNINTQTGTSYTLVAADSGKIVELTNAASIALTADPTLPKGFCCTIVQGGAGVATIASSGSGTVVNRQSQYKTAGANAMCSVYVRSNSGSDAVFVFGGDTAT